MGILARITSGGKSSNKSNNSSGLANGDHASDKNRVLSPTDPTVINPLNAGSWETVRTAPVNDTPRYFNKTEADSLKKREHPKKHKRRNKPNALTSH
jgi:hypothetical protein